MVGADTKCLIDHLLGAAHEKKREIWFPPSDCGWLKNSKIKEGHLLALLCGELADVRLDKVFFFCR